MPRESRSFSLDIDDKTFAKRSKKLLDDLGKETKPFIREQSALLARDLAKFTPPFADKKLPDSNKNTVGTAKDIQQGKNAIDTDLKRICWSPLRKGAGPFYTKLKREAIKAGRFPNGDVLWKGVKRGRGFIEDVNTLKNWHYMHRAAKGRTKKVPKGEKPIVKPAIYKKYLKHRQKDVGIAKASFYMASLHFGGKHNAVRQIKLGLRKTKGKGTLKKTDKGYIGIIMGLAKGAYHTKAHLPKLQKDRNTKALKRLKILASKLAKETKLNDA